jgi:hypothetical protein
MTGLPAHFTGTLLDQAMILDQPVNRAFGFKPGTLISDAIASILAGGGITLFEIEPSSSKVRGTEWVTWPPGTKRLEIINDLCQLGSYYSLFFDNFGIAQVIKVPDLATTEATLTYGSLEGEQRVFLESIVETDDLLTAPNRYIVVNSSLTDEVVIGTYDVPETAPHSFANRGFIVASVHDIQGVDSNEEAKAVAKATGQADYSTFSWVTFDAAPDPRHDTFDIVSWETVNYREQSWTLTLSAAGPHRHELRRIYDDPVFGEDVGFTHE